MTSLLSRPRPPLPSCRRPACTRCSSPRSWPGHTLPEASSRSLARLVSTQGPKTSVQALRAGSAGPGSSRCRGPWRSFCGPTARQICPFPPCSSAPGQSSPLFIASAPARVRVIYIYVIFSTSRTYLGWWTCADRPSSLTTSKAGHRHRHRHRALSSGHVGQPSRAGETQRRASCDPGVERQRVSCWISRLDAYRDVGRAGRRG